MFGALNLSKKSCYSLFPHTFSKLLKKKCVSAWIFWRSVQDPCKMRIISMSSRPFPVTLSLTHWKTVHVYWFILALISFLLDTHSLSSFLRISQVRRLCGILKNEVFGFSSHGKWPCQHRFLLPLFVIYNLITIFINELKDYDDSENFEIQIS